MRVPQWWYTPILVSNVNVIILFSAIALFFLIANLAAVNKYLIFFHGTERKISRLLTRAWLVMRFYAHHLVYGILTLGLFPGLPPGFFQG